jgi:L-threonylcarbamoyladenylate synthase
MEVIKERSFNKIFKIAVRALKEGKILVCPTDTVYGLCCKSSDKKAVERLFKIKRRKKSKPVSIFVKNLKEAEKIAFIGKEQKKFLKNPKITSILKAKKSFPEGIEGKGKKIGIRIPDFKFLNKILRKIDFPLTGTSANISGKPASGNFKKVLKQFENKKNQPDLLIDFGKLKENRPSRVVDLTFKNPKFLRK